MQKDGVGGREMGGGGGGGGGAGRWFGRQGDKVGGGRR